MGKILYQKEYTSVFVLLLRNTFEISIDSLSKPASKWIYCKHEDVLHDLVRIEQDFQFYHIFYATKKPKIQTTRGCTARPCIYHGI